MPKNVHHIHPHVIHHHDDSFNQHHNDDSDVHSFMSEKVHFGFNPINNRLFRTIREIHFLDNEIFGNGNKTMSKNKKPLISHFTHNFHHAVNNFRNYLREHYHHRNDDN